MRQVSMTVACTGNRHFISPVFATALYPMSPPDTTLDGLRPPHKPPSTRPTRCTTSTMVLSPRSPSASPGSPAALAAVAACEAAQSEADDPSWDKHALQARLYYLRGKAIASTEEGRLSDEAERLLADAVKLKPSLNDAWNCLGECFWERGELDTARHTFHGALEHERTCATLCHLSMLLRINHRSRRATARTPSFSRA